MLQELYKCDRLGCKNTTRALGRGAFFYEDANWIGVKLNTGEPFDFCSFECLGLWVDKKIEERREGKSSGK